MEISEDDYLAHYGTPRHSGRYPYGSGGEEDAAAPRNKSFLDTVDSLRKQGLSEADVAKGMGITTTQLRVQKSIEKNRAKQDQINMAQRLKEKGYSNVAIGERMKLNESSVRSLLAPGEKDKLDVLHTTANMLKDQVARKEFVDVGTGAEIHAGVSRDKLNAAIAVLQNEGYKTHYVKRPQLGTGKETTFKILTAPDVSYSHVFKNKDNIQQIGDFTEDGGRSYHKVHPPIQISSKRVGVRYADQGGTEADGVIYVRPGVKDVSLGKSRYAQVRIAVDGTHYLKGMAVYKDDLPDGVDLMFNTNKSDTGKKTDAFKKISEDPENPFAAITRQIQGPDGKPTSAMNILNEEGDWDKWSRNLSTQMLSKQSPSLAKAQLDLAYLSKKEALDEINALTNPTVKKKLLESFADDADSSAVHLKAAALPRQRFQVILPVSSMKETEIYAPNFRNGERVVLIRHPHGGIFEIPELTVNNNQPEAKKLFGGAQDAVGINAKTAERLSGADFDGDSVLVIPNNKKLVKTAPALAGLKDFDPKASYPAYPGMPEMTPKQKGFQMGDVSNLITDMTIKGATTTELARAVRHSMVVIDAEKHNLDYKASARDNGIANLKAKYQQRPDGKAGGASTLISRASADIRVDEKKGRPAAEGGPIDRATGKKVFKDTPETFTNKDGQVIVKRVKSQKLAETDDANTLSSGTTIERVYADHSNNLKALANTARKSMINTPPLKSSAPAKVVYKKEVGELNAALQVAFENRPRERQAQVIANALFAAKRQANPDLDASELKREKSKALTEARARTGAKKQRIVLTDQQWQAIQAGAITDNKLKQILANSDLDQVKKLATPKATISMTGVKIQKAQLMLSSGYTQAEVADALGVSLTTLKTSIGGD